MKINTKLILLSVILLLLNRHAFAEATTIRIGVLPFGTLNWELQTLQNDPDLSSQDFKIELHPVANPQAGKIAIQADAVDMIVSDWIWVSRQRAGGGELTFYPYSNTAGALLVAAESPIHAIADLKGKRLGIAGGELDKNWLLLQALATKQFQIDLNSELEKVFAAPPLLNQQLLQGRIDAILNYWHYAARLESQGFRQINNGNNIIKSLGVNASVPSLGYVFKQSWAEQHQPALKTFLQVSRNAKNKLCENDNAWQNIVPLTKAPQAATQKLLRERYCQGRVRQWGDAEQQAAENIYKMLKQLSSNRLTGDSATIANGTFWSFK